MEPADLYLCLGLGPVLVGVLSKDGYTLSPVMELRNGFVQDPKTRGPVLMFECTPISMLISISTINVPAWATLIQVDSLNPLEKARLVSAMATGLDNIEKMRLAQSGIRTPTEQERSLIKL